jgi:general secretion pathway protein G
MAINNKKWFTLVEMLIVIVIIGILAAALIPRLTGAQAQARDTARLADLNQLWTALAVYQGNAGTYPPLASYFATNDLDVLLQERYIKKIPTDPQSNRTTTFCEDPLSWISSYTYIGALGEYWYMLLGDGHFVLSANTEINKKWNRIPSSDTAINATGCISDWDANQTDTFAELNSYIIKWSTVTNSVVDTIYIYAN